MSFRLKLILLFALFISIQGSKFVIDPSQNAVMHNQQGVIFLRDGFYYDAIKEFKIAIMLKPEKAVTATFYNNLGLAYLKIREYDWAIDCFERSIEINPNFYEYFKNIVESYKQKKDISSAFKKYKKLITQDESFSSGWLMCGLIKKEMGDNEESLTYLNHYVFLEPDLILTEGIKGLIKELEIEIETDKELGL